MERKCGIIFSQREREREIAQVSGVVDTQSSLECREPCIPVCWAWISCFDNSGFSGVVTLKLPGGVFAM